jgi:homoserine O-acetyltransferase
LELHTHTEKFTNALYLESGRILEPYEITYETYGKLNADKSNVIVICHALTGSHHAGGRYEAERKNGWWDDLIGPGKPVDTDRYFVICTNVIGSCFGSTGPMSLMYPIARPYRFKFPVITIKDMVKAQRILFDRLGIHHVKAVIGGSMGGMQALHFAIDFPNFTDTIVALATTHASSPWVIAFNKVAMEAIKNDPEFENGEYDPAVIREKGLKGAAIGRMGGHISFLSPYSMQRKFGRDYVAQDGLFELFGRFEVERYLDYNGDNFPKWFDPLSFLYIAKAINIYDISRGYDSLEDAMARISAELHLISFEKDMLFFPEEMKVMADTMTAIGKGSQCSYLNIDSDYGHDAFLVELDKFKERIIEILT